MQRWYVRWYVRAAIIVCAGASVGMIANAVSPRGVALGTAVYAAAESGTGACDGSAVVEIPPAEALALCDTCDVAFVDARSALAFARGHIPGAVHLPPEGKRRAEEVLGQLRAHTTVVVYGDDTACDQARNIATRVSTDGHPDVRILTGGWPSWLAHDQPSESGACGECPGFEHP